MDQKARQWIIDKVRAHRRIEYMRLMQSLYGKYHSGAGASMSMIMELVKGGDLTLIPAGGTMWVECGKMDLSPKALLALQKAIVQIGLDDLVRHQL